MDRVPTWAELRLDALELAQLQRECYRVVHKLLDSAIPELDRKIYQVCHHKVVDPYQELRDLALPRPLSYYLRKRRPDFIHRASKRAQHIKKISEKRLITKSLKRVRLTSRDSSSIGYDAPDYQVRCKLSEREMKRITAKTYKRLPEVKKRRKEEVCNHMKVQNYKNKLEYGRKLLENRRQGIINYPLIEC